MKKEGIVTKEELDDARREAIEVALKHSPDLSKLVSVKIDDVTTIYIQPGKDPEQARQRFVSQQAKSRKAWIDEVKSAFYVGREKD